MKPMPMKKSVMTRPHCAVSFSVRSATLVFLLLVLSGCASTGFLGSPVNSGPEANNAQPAPAYVQNLPKSRYGNMEQYTVFGKQYKVMDSAVNFTEQGTASWYGKKFHGRKTSSGEVYDMHAMTAAHKHIPLPTFVRVTNVENNLSVVVKVNDRGPFVGDRIIDMSYAAAQQLGMVEKGTAQVIVEGLSSHHVAQNESATELVATNEQSIPAQPPAPEIIEAQVAVVPIQPALEPAEQVGQITIDSSEDGFSEVPKLGAASIAVPAVDPSAVGELATADLATADVYVQLGAFASVANAHALVDDVDEQTGLPAYVERDAERRLFRVKMGPFHRGQLLENTLESLASIGIDSYTKLSKKY